jgi:hypothetical protein
LFRAARRLKELGILGMNRRNVTCILVIHGRSSDDFLRQNG